jgi:hypothetical protein
MFLPVLNWRCEVLPRENATEKTRCRPEGRRYKIALARVLRCIEIGKEVRDMNEGISLEGPLEWRDGQLVLLIPLDAGGSELIECAKGISEVAGEFLKVEISEWLAGLLRVVAGDRVIVGNADGKFQIRAVNPRPVN